MGRASKVDWEESAQELYELYKGERDTERRKRMHALWLVRSGRPLAAAAELAGAGTGAPWSAGFRGPLSRRSRGGAQEQVPGHGAPGSACRLSEEQGLEELVVRALARGGSAPTPNPRVGGGRVGRRLRVQGDVCPAP